MKQSRIILTGFMGTGKTAVAQLLAERLKYEFLDTDLMVEKETKKTVTEIFEVEGEESFRIYEKTMVQKALAREKVVVATGGGAIVDPESLKLMKERGVIIGLSASPEMILKRVEAMQTRPLLKTKDKLKKIEALLSHRSPYYRQADKIVDTSSQSIEKTVDDILKFLHANDSR